MNYFIDCHTVEAIKARYRELAFRWHPDTGQGDTAIMSEINNQYHKSLARANGQTSDDGKHTYNYKQDIEQALIDKIGQILALRRSDIDVALIGTWLWITGNTRECREDLKKLGMKWHTNRQAWYFHVEKWQGRRSPHGLSVLAQKYGYQSFVSREREAIRQD